LTLFHKRQKINDILVSQKKFYAPGLEEETLSVGSENGTIFDDYALIIPHEDKLARFEADLIVMNS